MVIIVRWKLGIQHFGSLKSLKNGNKKAFLSMQQKVLFFLRNIITLCYYILK